MVVLTSALYCTAGCRKGTTPRKPREEKHHAKITPFGSSTWKHNAPFWVKKASPSLLVSFRNCWAKRVWDFPTLEPVPMAGAVCPAHADVGNAAVVQHQPPQAALPCFAEFPTLSSHFPGARNWVTTNPIHQSKHTNICESQTKVLLPFLRTNLCYLRTGAFHQNLKPDCTIWQHIQVCLCHFILICNLKTRSAWPQLFHHWNNSQHMPFLLG